MFGRNPIEKQVLTDGQQLHIVEGSPWPTIQGEGPYLGHPAIFLRLHGCPLRCTFCDTQFSDPNDPVQTIDQIVAAISAIRTHEKLVVCTGGEPMRQNIVPLCRQLKAAGFLVQIETAGILWLPGIEWVAQLVCSPKTPTIDARVRQHAVAFKYVIDAEQQFDSNGEYGYIPITATQPGARPQQLASPRLNAPVYLSPCNVYDAERNRANKKLVADLAMKYGVIAGCQLHVELGIKEPT